MFFASICEAPLACGLLERENTGRLKGACNSMLSNQEPSLTIVRPPRFPRLRWQERKSFHSRSSGGLHRTPWEWRPISPCSSSSSFQVRQGKLEKDVRFVYDRHRVRNWTPRDARRLSRYRSNSGWSALRLVFQCGRVHKVARRGLPNLRIGKARCKLDTKYTDDETARLWTLERLVSPGEAANPEVRPRFSCIS